MCVEQGNDEEYSADDEGDRAVARQELAEADTLFFHLASHAVNLIDATIKVRAPRSVGTHGSSMTHAFVWVPTSQHLSLRAPRREADV